MSSTTKPVASGNEKCTRTGLAIDGGLCADDGRYIPYWLTMVILGIGWNFLFLSGTNLLRYGYRDEERFKVQSFNDFLVFSIQGLASLSSGWFLYHWGWQGVLLASVPLVLVFALLAGFSRGFDTRVPQTG